MLDNWRGLYDRGLEASRSIYREISGWGMRFRSKNRVWFLISSARSKLIPFFWKGWCKN